MADGIFTLDLTDEPGALEEEVRTSEREKREKGAEMRKKNGFFFYY